MSNEPVRVHVSSKDVAAAVTAGETRPAEPRMDPRDAEIARLRDELMNSLAEKAEMQDDLDAAHRLLGLAPYPLTA